MELSHTQLLELGDLLGYQMMDEGLCAGFSGMWGQAVLLKDEAAFFSRLKLMEQYHDDFNILVEKIESIKEKVANSEHITQEERQHLDILSFYDGISLYLNAGENSEFFNMEVEQAQLDKIFPLTKPDGVEENLEPVFNKTFAYDSADLENYIEDLTEILAKADVSVPVYFTSHEHEVCAKYDKESECWFYLDANKFGKSYFSEDYGLELPPKLLAYYLKGAFTEEGVSQNLIMHTQITTLGANDQLKQSLAAIDEKYKIGPKQALLKDKNNNSLLLAACAKKDLEAVKTLLSLGADVNVNADSTPLYQACGHNASLEIVKLLLAAGANPNQLSDKGFSPLMVAITGGDDSIGIIDELITNDANVNGIDTYQGFSVLMQSIMIGNQKVVHRLIQHGAKVNECSFDGYTPLWLACGKGNVDIVKELLAVGAKVDFLTQGSSVLNNAVCNGNNLEVVKKLLQEGLDPNIANHDHGSPLYNAVGNQSIDMVNELLAYNANPNLAGDDGETPLYIAAYNANKDLIGILIKHGANVNFPTAEGTTPLMAAIQSEEVKQQNSVVEFLIENGARLTDKDNQGHFPLDLAVTENNQDVIVSLFTASLKQNLKLDQIISKESLETLQQSTSNTFRAALMPFEDEANITNVSDFKSKFKTVTTAATTQEDLLEEVHRPQV